MENMTSNATDGELCEWCLGAAGVSGVIGVAAGVTNGVTAFGAGLIYTVLWEAVGLVSGVLGDDMRNGIVASTLAIVAIQGASLVIMRKLLWTRISLMTITTLPSAVGVVLGAICINALDKDAVRYVAGSLFVLIALQKLTNMLTAHYRKTTPPEPVTHPAEGLYKYKMVETIMKAVPAHTIGTDKMFVMQYCIALVVAGFFFGLISAPGPPAMAYFAHAGTPTDDIRVIYGPVVFAMCFESVVVHMVTDAFTPGLVHITSFVGGVLGFVVGKFFIAPRVPVPMVRFVVFLLVLASGMKSAGVFDWSVPTGPYVMSLIALWAFLAACYTGYNTYLSRKGHMQTMVSLSDFADLVEMSVDDEAEQMEERDQSYIYSIVSRVNRSPSGFETRPEQF